MLINVQFLRFVAALLVVLYHGGGHVLDAGASRGLIFMAGEAVGFAGVDVFFVISGFIMYHTTRELSGRAEAGKFLRRRVARIYSGYWPFFLIAIAVWAWASPPLLEQAELLPSAFLWPTRHLLLPVAWTLVFEMYFYLLFTGLVWFDVRRRQILLLAGFAALLIWSLWSEFGRHAYAPGQLEYISLPEYYMFSPYILEFLAGSLLAWWLAQRPAGHHLSLLASGLVLFAIGGWVNATYFDFTIEQGYFMAPRVALFGSASVLIVAGLVRLEHAGYRAPLKFSLLAGGASYAIYLSHTLVLVAMQKLGFNAALRGSSDLIVNLAFVGLSALIVVYSIIHFKTIESWLHKMFKRTLRVASRPVR